MPSFAFSQTARQQSRNRQFRLQDVARPLRAMPDRGLSLISRLFMALADKAPRTVIVLLKAFCITTISTTMLGKEI